MSLTTLYFPVGSLDSFSKRLCWLLSNPKGLFPQLNAFLKMSAEIPHLLFLFVFNILIFILLESYGTISFQIFQNFLRSLMPWMSYLSLSLCYLMQAVFQNAVYHFTSTLLPTSIQLLLPSCSKQTWESRCQALSLSVLFLLCFN